jgi:hypothetical protein
VWRMPSPDHRIQVELRPHRDRTCVRVGGRQQGCFEGVAAGGLTFSPDSRHLAYPVAIGARWRVMRDGRAGADWDGVAAPTFSPDGRHLVYAARQGRSWRLVQDGTPGEAWDSLCASSITLSPQGDHVAYVAVGPDGVHAVRDEQPEPAYDRIETLRLSPHGTHLAYVAWRAGRATLVVDGAAGSFHDSLAGPMFRLDGNSVACAVRDSDAWFVIRDDAALGPFASARVIGYGGRGDSLVSVVRTPEGEAVCFGSVVGPGYASVESPAFSRNRLQWGYIARRGDSSVVVLDAAIHRVEEQASGLAFSDDGARHAYIASRGGRACIVDDAGAHPYELLIAGSLVFDRNGTWACVAGDPRKRRLFVTVEGIRRRRAFDWTMMARITRSSPEFRVGRVDDAVRSWIAAEAERIREERSAPH